jgi:hypothetical protein
VSIKNEIFTEERGEEKEERRTSGKSYKKKQRREKGKKEESLTKEERTGYKYSYGKYTVKPSKLNIISLSLSLPRSRFVFYVFFL